MFNLSIVMAISLAIIVVHSAAENVAHPQLCSTERLSPRIVCYFTSWSKDRPDPWKYKVDNIPKNDCTHILYSFAGLDNSTYEIKSFGPPSGESSYEDFLRLRELSPKSKLMLSIGGWGEFGTKYSMMVSDPVKRKVFVNSVVDTFKKYKFDGFDIDWEYPGSVDRGGKAEDKENFLTLVKELRQAFDTNFNRLDRGHLELTAAVPVTKKKVSQGFAVKELCQVLDAIHMMTYDLRGAWDKNVDVHTPLYPRPFDIDTDNEKININDAGELWNSEGCPRHKLVVGNAFYGRSFTLEDPLVHGLHAPANKTNVTGKPGPYLNESGFMAYFEICQKLEEPQVNNSSSWTLEWDNIGKVPYTYKDDQWIGFENAQSLTIKMNHIRSRGYGGAMFWALDLDDYLGLCNKTNPIKNVLLNTITKGMAGYKVPIELMGQ